MGEDHHDNDNDNDRKKVPENAPQHCPGVESDQAGKASQCAGCPNQSICSTGAARDALIDPHLSQISERMATVKHKILVLSGKGGVGKSTVSAQLAFALSDMKDDNTRQKEQKEDDGEDEEQKKFQVGLLDLDICGPSIPRIVGLEGEQIHQSNLGWSPVYVEDNLAVMSIGFLLNDPSEAVIWRGPKKNGLIKQFLKDVYWSDLDFLVIDTPPGTSDEHLSIVQFLKEVGVTGAIIVTTPQEVSLMDVRKEINFCKKVGIPILGIIENMSTFVCPNCQKESKIFEATTGGAEGVAEKETLEVLGKLPLDPLLTKACDSGQNFLRMFPSSFASKPFLSITQKVLAAVSRMASS